MLNHSRLISSTLGATLLAAALIQVPRMLGASASPGVQQPERPRNVVNNVMLDRTVRPLCLDISPGGGTLAVACTDRLVYLLRPFSGEKRLTLAGDQLGSIRGLAFMPDGKTIAVISDDKQLRLWDTDSGKLLSAHPALRDKQDAGLPPLLPTSLAVSPDGGLIAVGGAGAPGRSGIVRLDESSFLEIRVFDAKAGDLKWSHLVSPGFLNRLTFSPDGKTLAGDTSADVRLWDAKTGKRTQVLKPVVNPPAGGIWDVAFSPDNRLVAGYGTARVDGQRKSWLTVWGLPSGEILHSIEAGDAGSATAPGTLAFSPDGKSLATAGVGYASVPISIPGRDLGVVRKLVNDVKLWDVATGSLKWTSPAGDLGYVTSLVFSPDGLSVYCCDSSAVSRIDARTGQTRKDLMTTAGDPEE
jgi:WD40 repeat protein